MSCPFRGCSPAPCKSSIARGEMSYPQKVDWPPSLLLKLPQDFSGSASGFPDRRRGNMIPAKDLSRLPERLFDVPRRILDQVFPAQIERASGQG